MLHNKFNDFINESHEDENDEFFEDENDEFFEDENDEFFVDEFLDCLYLAGTKDDEGRYVLTVSQATAAAKDFRLKIKFNQ